MEALKMFMLGLAVTSASLLLAGFISPVLVLWWMDYQNRLRVLRIYGSLFLISLLLYLVL